MKKKEKETEDPLNQKGVIAVPKNARRQDYSARTDEDGKVWLKLPED